MIVFTKQQRSLIYWDIKILERKKKIDIFLALENPIPILRNFYRSNEENYMYFGQ